ncbi:MAG: hypothetical protein IKQ82_08755, partial [Lentisphaeria bacterium]|nr:hypothetical protein [Lentisphaeria bacterium]
MMLNTKMRRSIVLAVIAVVLIGAAFIAYKMFEEPGHAEFKAGKAAYRTGDYKSAVEHYKLAADQGNLKAQTLVG